MKKILLALAFVSAMGLSMKASANAFTIIGISFNVGSGYGSGSGQLDVSFVSDVTPQSFSLDPGESTSFHFGSVSLGEKCINSGSVFVDLLACGFFGADGNETDNLDVTANLMFSNPLAKTVQNIAFTGALVGPVNGFVEDYLADYAIIFKPVTVKFGDGGSFFVNLSDLYFFKTGQADTDVTIRLKSASAAVPEPATLAMLGIGLLGLGMTRRRKQEQSKN